MTEAKMGDVVRINYTGRLTDGTEFDSSVDKKPLEFTIGQGQVIKGLETQVAGMVPGDKNTVTIPCDLAYGQHRPEAIQKVDRSKVPNGLEIAVGTQLQARTSDGGLMPITVVDVDDESIKVDANHPLAGKDLVFEVELLEIVEAA